ncbi:unnamed protein product [Diatraea saccharalis]|uniref:Uncharacterized protein n=1 Tax=Diatraea saccharalis TaxID=40085 RepID=A0A9N9WGA5_9NEOP|nr:unnamed protein product [Diatraea saccharalis]
MLLHEEDTTESIAKAFALQLKDMSKLQRIIAEKLISEIMFYGKLDQLTVNSSINLNRIASSQSPSPSPVNKNNLQTRRHIYMPISPASEYRYTYTPSPSQSPASHIYEHTAYIENNNVSCNSVVLSIPEIDCQVLPTETQMSSTQYTSDLPIGNQSIFTPQFTTPQLFTPHPTLKANIIYEGDGKLIKRFSDLA